MLGPAAQRRRVALLLALSFLLMATPTSGQDLRDLNSHCPFAPPESLQAWQRRADELKLQLTVALGTTPTIDLPPVRPSIYGRIAREDYELWKVTFESLPGLYVTGNLYRPHPLPEGKHLPAILCPHGHWPGGRFMQTSHREVRQQLASGAERFEAAAQSPLQARCVQLARMGCIVFHWDMIGYADSTQISYERAHRFAHQPAAEEMTEEGWLLFSPWAEMHAQSVMGLQTLATHRAVDMLLTLPEVDPARIGITGASGGGTQTFLGAALDPRIAVAFPAVMVSTGMQGGCTCENACLLRVGTGNVEIAGLIAPRPLGLTAADDWTRTMPTDGFPQLKQLYGLFGHPDRVELFPALHFGHNYNHVSRVAMYGFINKHFQLGFEPPILERDFPVTPADQLSVWDDEHSPPPGGESFERQLLRDWAARVDQFFAAAIQAGPDQRQQAAQILTAGWRTILGLTTLPYQEVEPRAQRHDDGSIEFTAEGLPSWRLLILDDIPPEADNSSFAQVPPAADNPAAVWQSWQPSTRDLHIDAITDEGTEQRYYLEVAGWKWSAEDDFSLQRVAWQARVPNPRLAAAYTYGYNLPLAAIQAQQIGMTLTWLASQHPEGQLIVHGAGWDALLAIAGAFCAQQRHDNLMAQRLSLEIDALQADFASISHVRHPAFLPAALRFWGVPGLLACLHDMRIHGKGIDQLPHYNDLQLLYERQQVRIHLGE
ncbi:MAG: acetylxylan esterase [Pirellulaceae bacterium]|nr:MAG: acetylxylan esterase [Pirellulaceae bacterium]